MHVYIYTMGNIRKCMCTYTQPLWHLCAWTSNRWQHKPQVSPSCHIPCVPYLGQLPLECSSSWLFDWLHLAILSNKLSEDVTCYRGSGLVSRIQKSLPLLHAYTFQCSSNDLSNGKTWLYWGTCDIKLGATKAHFHLNTTSSECTY